MSRVVTVTVELDFVEGEHFNLPKEDISDEQAIMQVESRFYDIIHEIGYDLFDYMQSKVGETAS